MRQDVESPSSCKLRSDSFLLRVARSTRRGEEGERSACVCVCVACLRVSNKTRPASAAVFHTAVEKAKTHKTKKHEFCADTDMAARRTTAAVGLLPQKTRGPHKKTSPPAENNRPKSRRALPQGLGACCALSGVSGNTMWWRRALRGVGVFWGRMGERANFRRKESGVGFRNQRERWTERDF